MRKFLVSLYVVLMSFSAMADEIIVNPNNAHELIASINKAGGDVVFHKLLQHNDWEKVWSHIETGKEEWLEVADALSCCVDAAAAETLPIVISRALAHSPTSVLKRLQNGQYQLDEICSVPFFEPTKLEFDSHVKALKKALKKVNAPELQSTKDKCNNAIDATHWTEEAK